MAADLEVDTTSTTLDATVGTKDNKYNVIVEKQLADTTWEVVKSQIVETVDASKISLKSAKIKTAYGAEELNFFEDTNIKIEDLVKKDGSATIELAKTSTPNQGFTFDATTKGYKITLKNDEFGNLDTTWEELAAYVNGNTTLKAAYKMTVKEDGDIALVSPFDASITLAGTYKAETPVVVELTFSSAVKLNASGGKVTIDGKEYTISSILNATTADITLTPASGENAVKTATKVEELEGFTNANDTPVIVKTGGVAITPAP